MNQLMTMICKLVKAGQTSKRLTRYVAKKAIALRADLGFGFMRLRRPMLSWAAEVLRANRTACPRASEVRHVIFSTPKGMARRSAIAALYAVFTDWRTAYSPDRPWVAGIHSHNGIHHLHAAISNVDASGKPLKFRPHQVLDMAEIKFTKHAVSAKGRGKRGLPIYTKARGKLAVRDLAALVINADGNINNEAWLRLKEEGSVSGFRNRKDGSLVSFEFQGRRIRLATLKHFVEQLQPAPKGTASPAPPPPHGLTSKDVDAINTALQRASVPSARTPAKSKTRNRNLRKR